MEIEKKLTEQNVLLQQLEAEKQSVRSEAENDRSRLEKQITSLEKEARILKNKNLANYGRELMNKDKRS